MPKGDFIGEFELYVLLSAQHLGDDAYGVTIRRRIEDRTGREVAVGAIYATLGRLEAKGLVSFTLSDPEPIQGGRSRKYVHLTAAGRRALNTSTDAMMRMIDARPAPARGRTR